MGKRVNDSNRLSIVKPDLLKEWNYEKNSIKPDCVSFGSHKKVWWKCENKHEWIGNIQDRVKGRRCPYCSGNRVYNKNNLLVSYPEICEEWNYEKNVLGPETFHESSNKKVWWKCKEGHEWLAVISNRSKNKTGCPYCSGRFFSGKNSLSDKNPDLCKEWNYKKNDSIKPENVSFHTHKKVWWICKNGHEWERSVSSRMCGNGCPFCSNFRIDKNNCFANKFPNLVKEWDVEKNLPYTPFDVGAFSSRKIWWKCKEGHEWIADLYHRCKRGHGCPVCSKIILTDGSSFDSLPEAYLYLRLKSRRIDVIFNKEYGYRKYRYDFYVPKFNTYIEITSFDEKFYRNRKEIWIKYLSKILQKKNYVENVLMANFRFIQIRLNMEQIKYVRTFQVN